MEPETSSSSNKNATKQKLGLIRVKATGNTGREEELK